MNVATNEAYLKSQKRRAFIIQAVGMGLVFLSFILSFVYIQEPALIFVAYPALLVGWPLWLWGRGASRRWATAAKVDDAVSAELKGLNSKYALFHQVVLGKTVLDHVLISPDGVLVVEMKEGGGTIASKAGKAGEDRWSMKVGFIDRIARWGDELLGNPTLELDSKIAALRDWVAAQGVLPGPLPVTGVVAFYNPATALNIESSKYDVLRLPELKEYMLAGPTESKRVVLLPTDERNRLIAALRGLLPVVAEKAPPAAKSGTPAKPGASPTSRRRSGSDSGATQPLSSNRPAKR
jgi:hypothetical protein